MTNDEFNEVTTNFINAVHDSAFYMQALQHQHPQHVETIQHFDKAIDDLLFLIQGYKDITIALLLDEAPQTVDLHRLNLIMHDLPKVRNIEPDNDDIS